MVEIRGLFRIRGAAKLKLPKHIAFTVEDSLESAEEKKVPLSEQLEKDFSLVKAVVMNAFHLKIPVLTFLLLPEKMKESEHFSTMMDAIAQFFTGFSQWDYISKNQVKISILGKWYDLPGRVVEAVKKTIEETKDYDHFFLNFCVNYDGQEEIVSAAQLVSRQVKLGRIDPSSITRETIKENLYSSYFIPPDIIVKTGKSRSLGGVLLWDSVNATIYFSEKPWSDFSKKDFLKAVEIYQKQGF
jgi:undecaprenyl diphosphate synthase